MSWIRFWRAIAIATIGELKTLIRDTAKNDSFDFTPTAIGPILAQAGNWRQSWTEMFKSLLSMAKAAKGCKKDKKNAKGSYASVRFPDNSEEYMVIFFAPPCPPKTARFLIYDFKIVRSKLRNK